MRINAVLALTAVAFELTACTYSSGVKKLDSNRYVVNTQVPPHAGGLNRARGNAYREAVAFCGSMEGLSTLINYEVAPAPGYVGSSVEIGFRCEKVALLKE